MVVERWYDFHEFEGHLGNVGLKVTPPLSADWFMARRVGRGDESGSCEMIDAILLSGMSPYGPLEVLWIIALPLIVAMIADSKGRSIML